VELARDVSEKFNKIYGDTFVLPTPVIPKVGGRIMSLTNPNKKMSKSVDDPMGTINLLDSKEDIVKKIMSATTDSDSIVRVSADKPGITNLIEIFSQLSSKKVEDIEKMFEGATYKDFKSAVSDELVRVLSDLQEKFDHFRNEDRLKEILDDGSLKAYKISHPLLTDVYSKIGFI
jgi:tryptophanyl-tRNA synthetase